MRHPHISAATPAPMPPPPSPRCTALADAPPSHLRHRAHACASTTEPALYYPSRCAQALHTGTLLALPVMLSPCLIVLARCSPPPPEFPPCLDSSVSRLPLVTSLVFLSVSHARALVILLAGYHSSSNLPFQRDSSCSKVVSQIHSIHTSLLASD